MNLSHLRSLEPIPAPPPMPAAIARPEAPQERPANLLRVGVIGYGYWGPNIVRNLQNIETCQVASVCDKSAAALRRASRLYPDLKLTTDFASVLTAPDIDAIAVITPVWTHYELAK